MRQQLLVGPGQFALREVPLPVPLAGQALIRVERAGICGSDLHIYRNQSFIKPPVVLGHEFAGVVAAVGQGVNGTLTGQRVAVNPGVNCGQCIYCCEGASNVCERQLCIGACSEWPGGFAEYALAPATNLIQLPDHLSYEAAALIEPAAVALHALDKVVLRDTSRVVVLGLGTVGQLIAQACRMRGAGCIVTGDPLPSRRAVSERLGADGVFDPCDASSTDIIHHMLGGVGADVVLDTASNPNAFAAGLRLLRRGGRYVDVGEAVEQVSFDLNSLAFYEIELTGVNMYFDRNFDEALQAIASGALQVSPLVSALCTLEDIGAAFVELSTAPDRHIKILLTPQG